MMLYCHCLGTEFLPLSRMRLRCVLETIMTMLTDNNQSPLKLDEHDVSNEPVFRHRTLSHALQCHFNLLCRQCTICISNHGELDSSQEFRNQLMREEIITLIQNQIQVSNEKNSFAAVSFLIYVVERTNASIDFIPFIGSLMHSVFNEFLEETNSRNREMNQLISSLCLLIIQNSEIARQFKQQWLTVYNNTVTMLECQDLLRRLLWLLPCYCLAMVMYSGTDDKYDSIFIMLYQRCIRYDILRSIDLQAFCLSRIERCASMLHSMHHSMHLSKVNVDDFVDFISSFHFDTLSAMQDEKWLVSRAEISSLCCVSTTQHSNPQDETCFANNSNGIVSAIPHFSSPALTALLISAPTFLATFSSDILALLVSICEQSFCDVKTIETAQTLCNSLCMMHRYCCTQCLSPSPLCIIQPTGVSLDQLPFSMLLAFVSIDHSWVSWSLRQSIL